MKVAYVTGFYNGKVDGRLGRFHDWVHRLRDMDDPPFEHEVHAFTATNPDNTLASTPRSFLGDGDRMWGKRSNKIEYLANTPRICSNIRQSDSDVIHILHLSSTAYLTGVFSQDRPVVIGPDILGWNPIRSGGRWDISFPNSILPKMKYRFKQLLAHVPQYDAVTVYSSYHRRILSEIGVDESQIDCIPPGISPIFCSVTPASGAVDTDNNPEILYVGDFSDHKGFPEFVNAVGQLCKDITVTAIGAGNTHVAEARSNPQITVEGFIDRTDLPRYYQQADLYVMPSIDEAGPNTIIEALASGTPIVATDKGGINEFPPTDSSVLFWPRNTAALTTAIETAVSKLPQLTAAAQSHADRFHVDRTINHLDSFYRELLNSNS